MRIASQTKAITSIGLMILFEEGKFLLDEPVSKYIPAFRNPKVLDKFNEKDSSYTTVPARREITIRQLFTHTSGISYPSIGTKEANAMYAKARIPSGIGTPNGKLADAMNALGALPLVHQPGERFTYGLNTDVLGYLIEVLSGQSLDQFLRTRLFEPLDMKDTYFYLPAEKHNRLAVLYTEDAQKNTIRNPVRNNQTPDYPKLKGSYFSGGAGLSSTAYDYAVFLQMLLNGGEYNGKRILSPATVRLITTNQIGDVNQGDNKFGLGFSITTTKGAAKLGVSEGAYDWGGIFGTTYWVDPQTGIVALLYTQKYPNSNGNLNDKFRVLVYQAITDLKLP
jgi:CubicO group peptidase (beta-lactamase class C family)